MSETSQEIFTKACRGLRAQGYRRSRGTHGCLYNGPGGIHCAVGWVISLPAEVCEGLSVDGLAERGLVPREALDLLRELQYTHDVYGYTPTTMQNELLAIARVRGLTFPPEDGQDPMLSISDPELTEEKTNV